MGFWAIKRAQQNFDSRCSVMQSEATPGHFALYIVSKSCIECMIRRFWCAYFHFNTNAIWFRAAKGPLHGNCYTGSLVKSRTVQKHFTRFTHYCLHIFKFKICFVCLSINFCSVGESKGGGVCLLYPPLNAPLIFWKGIIQLNFMTIVELHPNVYISYFLIKTEDEFKMFFYIYTCPYKILHASSFIL